jgi:hypothetical protein
MTTKAIIDAGTGKPVTRETVAERFQKPLVRESDVLKILEKLPVRVFIGPIEANELGIKTGYMIRRGMAGYHPLPSLTDEVAKRWNDANSVTKAQIEAMKAGSMFGWEVPGADPENN